MRVKDLKALREAHDLTQHALADQLGVKQCTVAKWETGVAVPRLPMMFRLSVVLGVPMEALWDPGAGSGTSGVEAS